MVPALPSVYLRTEIEDAELEEFVLLAQRESVHHPAGPSVRKRVVPPVGGGSETTRCGGGVNLNKDTKNVSVYMNILYNAVYTVPVGENVHGTRYTIIIRLIFVHDTARFVLFTI